MMDVSNVEALLAFSSSTLSFVVMVTRHELLGLRRRVAQLEADNEKDPRSTPWD
jgi:BMFP domain-containing protein YqiC